METNPYAPPQAPVGDIAPVGEAGMPVFFPVSRTKLIVMSVLTISLYQIVWFYKNWALVRARGERVWPLPRTLFAVFFCYDLMDRIRSHRRDLPSHGLPAGLLAAGWIVAFLISNSADPIGTRLGWPPSVLLLVLIVDFATVAFLVPAQDAANVINRQEAPDHEPNARFTGWNWLWIVIGVVLITASFLAAFIPAA